MKLVNIPLFIPMSITCKDGSQRFPLFTLVNNMTCYSHSINSRNMPDNARITTLSVVSDTVDIPY